MKSHAQRHRSSPVRLILRAFVVLVVPMAALLGLGRFMLAAAPVSVEILGDRNSLRLTVDGTSRKIDLDQPIVGVRPVKPIAFRREQQIDGSDSTNMLTLNPRYFGEFGTSPYYRFQALLREERRYSVWRNLEVADQYERVVLRQPQPIDDLEVGVPTPFRLDIDLERPEIPRLLELIDAESHSKYVEVNRNDKFVRVGPSPSRGDGDQIFFYFPRQWLPPFATLLDLVTRGMALALGLVLLVGGLALAMPARFTWLPGPRALRIGVPLGLLVLLGGCVYAAFALFDRAPHILDAVAYIFQAKAFAAGRLSLPPPPLDSSFQMPFTAIYNDRWFVQYPPGTAALLALGMLAHLPWLVEPLLAAGAALLTVLAVRRQYGPGTALLVLALLATSPFLLLNAAAYLSHVPALFFACVALYAATRYGQRPSIRWAALAAAGLGLALLTREIVTVLYGATIVLAGLLAGLWQRGRAVWLDLAVMAAIMGAAVGAYLGYNALVTGEPFLLPRLLVDGRDRYGFGPGVGFYNEHTLAAGLVNTEEQLVSLGFYLSGWPYGFSLALLLLPFLTRRLTSWDHAHGLLVLTYLLAYVGYYYHGIVFGPRYYVEMLPSLVILIARGFTALTECIGDWLDAIGRAGGWWRARLATGVLGLALFGCTFGYFLPRQAALYANYSGIPGGGPVLDDTIGHDLSGRYSRLDNALVVTDEWWYFVMYYAALNCPTLDCSTVFAVAADDEQRQELARFYPDRNWYDVRESKGVLVIEPSEP